MPTETRNWPLRDVLSVTTGRLMPGSSLDSFYPLIDWIGGRNTAGVILGQHPQLRGCDPPPETSGLRAWIANMARLHGRTLTITRTTNEETR